MRSQNTPIAARQLIEAGRDTRLVEEAYSAWNARGSRGFAEFTAEDVELHDAPELPDAAVWRGREALVSLTWRFEQGDPATLACV
jgi:hypothetical protein